MCYKCQICGSYDLKDRGHHIIKRSTNRALIKCPMNIVHLCDKHHYMIHHGNNGNELDIYLRWQIQSRLEMLLDKHYFTIEEIKDILEITEAEAERLVKTKQLHKEGYSREDIIQAFMVKKVTEEDLEKIDLNKYPESIY